MTAKALKLSSAIFLMFCLSSCSNESTCNNGVQDGTETGVDCGGDCSPCSQNSQSVTIDGTTKQALTVQAFLNKGFYLSSSGYPTVTGMTMSINYYFGLLGVLSVSFSNDDDNANCMHTGDFATQDIYSYGLNPFGLGLVLYTGLSGEIYDTGEFATNQTITLTKCDPVNSTISGNFNVTLQHEDNTTTKTISGSFTDVTYVDNR